MQQVRGNHRSNIGSFQVHNPLDDAKRSFSTGKNTGDSFRDGIDHDPKFCQAGSPQWIKFVSSQPQHEVLGVVVSIVCVANGLPPVLCGIGKSGRPNVRKSQVNLVVH
jgi:hypothetical protein